MSSVLVAVVVTLLVGLARVPWSVGGRGRLAQVGGRSAGGVRASAGAEDVLDLGARVDVVLVLDLLEVAVASGAALPRAVQAVGDAVGGDDGAALAAAARALVLGAGWSAAWSAVPPGLAPVADCLADSWSAGAAPGPRLRAAADEVNRDRRRTSREAAGRLGTRLVLPLGLCLLPAFVLLGLVPVVVSLAGGLLG